MKHILVLQRGWVVVGNCEKNGEEVIISNAAIIRRWGTTKGLGELAEKGPLKETVLDESPTIRVHELGIIMRMDCNEKNWK